MFSRKERKRENETFKTLYRQTKQAEIENAKCQVLGLAEKFDLTQIENQIDTFFASGYGYINYFQIKKFITLYRLILNRTKNRTPVNHFQKPTPQIEEMRFLKGFHNTATVCNRT